MDWRLPKFAALNLHAACISQMFSQHLSRISVASVRCELIGECMIRTIGTKLLTICCMRPVATFPPIWAYAASEYVFLFSHRSDASGAVIVYEPGLEAQEGPVRLNKLIGKVINKQL